MYTKVIGEQQVQILSPNFSISPSNQDYVLNISANGRDFSPLFAVSAGVTRLVSNVAPGSYYKLVGNRSEVVINWQRMCATEGGGSGTELTPIDYFPLDAEEGIVVAYNGPASATGVYQYDGSEWIPVGVDDLSAFWTSAQTKDYVDTAVSGIDLSNYYTKVETDSAITAVENHIYDVEEVAASAYTELHDDILEISARTIPDMSLYTPTSGFSTINGSAITNGGNIVISADLTNYWNSAQTQTAISAATQDMVTSSYVSTIWRGTQLEYDAITVKDPNTFYIIVSS